MSHSDPDNHLVRLSVDIRWKTSKGTSSSGGYSTHHHHQSQADVKAVMKEVSRELGRLAALDGFGIDILNSVFEGINAVRVYEGKWQLSPNHLMHDCYTDKDADRPKEICDSNHLVVLGLCKVCNAAEAELTERFCDPDKRKVG